MKISTPEISLSAKIQSINKGTFRDYISDLIRIKLTVCCEMSKSDYEMLCKLDERDMPLVVTLPPDLAQYKINEFIPPFDAKLLYLDAQYDGTNYQATLFFREI